MGASGQSTGYTIDQSARFDQAVGSYLQDPNSNAGDSRKKFTFSTWFKRGNLGDNIYFYSYRYDDNNLNNLYFDTNDKLNWIDKSGGSTQMNLITNRVFRDPSAFYHIVIVWDTAQAVTEERAKIYINGIRETSFSTETYPSSGADSGGANRASSNMRVAALGSNAGITDFFDGYFAETHYSDNYAYGPEYFGEFKENTDIWIPKEVDISYGSAGFYFDYANASNLGANTKGKGNFTVGTDQGGGLAAHDQVLDSPTNNFAVLNPVDTFGKLVGELRNGNLELKDNSASAYVYGRATLGFDVTDSGGWYWESVDVVDGSGIGGITEYNTLLPSGSSLAFTGARGFNSINTGNHMKLENTTYNSVDLGVTSNAGDIIQFCAKNGKLFIGINGTYVLSGNPATEANPLFSSLTGIFMPFAGLYSGASYNTIHNFGQDGTFAGTKTAQGNTDANGFGNFFYAPPTGAKALCSRSLGA